MVIVEVLKLTAKGRRLIVLQMAIVEELELNAKGAQVDRYPYIKH